MNTDFQHCVAHSRPFPSASHYHGDEKRESPLKICGSIAIRKESLIFAKGEISRRGARREPSRLRSNLSMIHFILIEWFPQQALQSAIFMLLFLLRGNFSQRWASSEQETYLLRRWATTKVCWRRRGVKLGLKGHRGGRRLASETKTYFKQWFQFICFPGRLKKLSNS